MFGNYISGASSVGFGLEAGAQFVGQGFTESLRAANSLVRTPFNGVTGIRNPFSSIGKSFISPILTGTELDEYASDPSYAYDPAYLESGKASLINGINATPGFILRKSIKLGLMVGGPSKLLDVMTGKTPSLPFGLKTIFSGSPFSTSSKFGRAGNFIASRTVGGIFGGALFGNAGVGVASADFFGQFFNKGNIGGIAGFNPSKKGGFIPSLMYGREGRGGIIGGIENLQGAAKGSFSNVDATFNVETKVRKAVSARDSHSLLGKLSSSSASYKIAVDAALANKFIDIGTKAFSSFGRNDVLSQSNFDLAKHKMNLSMIHDSSIATNINNIVKNSPVSKLKNTTKTISSTPSFNGMQIADSLTDSLMLTGISRGFERNLIRNAVGGKFAQYTGWSLLRLPFRLMDANFSNRLAFNIGRINTFTEEYAKTKGVIGTPGGKTTPASKEAIKKFLRETYNISKEKFISNNPNFNEDVRLKKVFRGTVSENLKNIKQLHIDEMTSVTRKMTTNTVKLGSGTTMGKMVAAAAAPALVGLLALKGAYNVGASTINASINTLRNVASISRNIGRMEFGSGRTLETAQASTERSRAIMAIQNVGISARSYLGREAQIVNQY